MQTVLYFPANSLAGNILSVKPPTGYAVELILVDTNGKPVNQIATSFPQVASTSASVDLTAIVAKQAEHTQQIADLVANKATPGLGLIADGNSLGLNPSVAKIFLGVGIANTIINTSNGQLLPAGSAQYAGYLTSKLLPIDASNTLTISPYISIGAWYDSNGVFVAGANGTFSNSKIPANAKFMRLSYSPSDYSKVYYAQGGLAYVRRVNGKVPDANGEILLDTAGLAPFTSGELNSDKQAYAGEVRAAVLKLINAGVTATPANQAPSVSFAPVDSSAPTAGTKKQYQAMATDQDGIAKVDLVLLSSASSQQVTQVLDTDTTTPYLLNWTPAAAGTYYLAAQATDNQGVSGLSSVLTVVVQAAASAPGGGNYISTDYISSDYIE